MTVGLAPGDPVEVSMFVTAPWWGNAFLKVVRDGEVMLAAAQGEGLSGGSDLPPAGFFEPLSVVVRVDLCEEEPEHEAGPFGSGPCTRDQRRGIEFGLDGDEAVVLDRNEGEVGPLRVYVGRTVRHVEVSCTDTPGGWVEFVALRA